MSRIIKLRPSLVAAPVLLPLLGMGGCTSGTLQALGLQRNPPNEFEVTTQPQLALPPDLNTTAAVLPPPTPGAPRPQDVAVPQQAADAMLGGAALAGGAPSTAGDQAFLQEAGPPAPANIRQQVDAIATRDKNSHDLGNRINPFGTPVATPALVNADAERQRLQKDAALGLSPTVGKTPLVKPKNNGPLGDLLNSIF